MEENNYTYNDKGQNLSVIKIEGFHCFCCGELFNKECKKTNHHSLPEELKPMRNIVIPVCEDCHRLIHQESQAMNPKKIKIEKKIERMKNHLTNNFHQLNTEFDKILGEMKNGQKKDT
jgi:hypothetical protein